jgi:hypothetical protein
MLKSSPPQEQYHKSEMPAFHKLYDGGILLRQITFIKVVGRLSSEACYEIAFLFFKRTILWDMTL